MSLHTHYDNLKVSRTAPQNVIKAAYKTLAQQYHPDRNPGDERAERIMKILNTSYEVLSDDEKRARYDLFLVSHEVVDERQAQPSPQQEPPVQQPPAPEGPESPYDGTGPDEPSEYIPKSSHSGSALHWLLLPIAIPIILFFIASGMERNEIDDLQSSELPSVTPPMNMDRPSSQFRRPKLSPEGKAWPSGPAYIGNTQDWSHGLSYLVFYNRTSNSDVLVKLSQSTGGPKSHIRFFYVPAGREFTIENIVQGTYILKFQNLRTGSYLRSSEIYLEESQSFYMNHYTKFTYEYRDGSSASNALPINKSEF